MGARLPGFKSKLIEVSNREGISGKYFSIAVCDLTRGGDDPPGFYVPFCIQPLKEVLSMSPPGGG